MSASLTHKITLAGWYGIGSREVDITATPSRAGVRLDGMLPGRDVTDLGHSDSVVVSWDEIERDGDAVRHAALRLATQLVREALPTKAPGEVYCDG